MGVSSALLATGWWLIDGTPNPTEHSQVAIAMLSLAVLIRSGCAPLHCWVTDMFENATFGTALLFVTPMPGAYAAARLVLPIAPEWILRGIALLALFTAVYAAGMALVQRDSRRCFCYLFLSYSSLVLIGMGIATPVGLAGSLCVWLSVGIASAGFGLTLRALESRTGRLSLQHFHGLYEQTPTLAVFFLVTGLASVGFPGTVGFVGTELLVEGVVSVYPPVGVLVVVAAALNGIAVLCTYFRVFTGRERIAPISLAARTPERVAVLALTVLLLGGGLYPQPGITSRYHAAKAVLERRIAPALESTDREPHSVPSLARNESVVAPGKTIANSDVAFWSSPKLDPAQNNGPTKAAWP
jgi:NADH-quinone oxidoreductase subunit M